MIHTGNLRLFRDFGEGVATVRLPVVGNYFVGVADVIWMRLAVDSTRSRRINK